MDGCVVPDDDHVATKMVKEMGEETADFIVTDVLIDIRINKAIVSAKKGEAPIDGCIFEGGAGTS